MKPVNRLMFAAAAAAVGLSAVSVPALAEEANYEVTVTSTWTAANFPLEYPEANLITGPHFSGVIGASTNGKYEPYKLGSMPTPGLERLSEEGKHSPLDEEIKAAVAAGTAGMLFEGDPLKDFSKTATTKVHVTSAYPMVSAVMMIAPSPDWFAGVSDVKLMDGGKFVAGKTVELYAYDSGGDDGATYKASDVDNNPEKATTTASTKHFGGKPVGKITFRKI
jgi:hypothetical protein